MFSAPHRIHPSSFLDSLLIGVSSESTMQTTMDKALFFLSLSSIVTSSRPTSVHWTTAPRKFAFTPCSTSTYLQLYRISKHKKKTIDSQQSDTPLLVPKCGLWVIRKRHTIQKSIFYGFYSDSCLSGGQRSMGVSTDEKQSIK